MTARRADTIRYRVDPGDVPADKAARRLHLTPEQFKELLPELNRRGFPARDPTTGMYDLDAIGAWEHHLGFVYFIRCGTFIKIGYSDDPKGRLAALQTANPYPLEMVGCCAGGQPIEYALHSHFRHLRGIGEWFREDDELLAVAQAPLYAVYRPGGLAK